MDLQTFALVLDNFEAQGSDADHAYELYLHRAGLARGPGKSELEAIRALVNHAAQLGDAIDLAEQPRHREVKDYLERSHVEFRERLAIENLAGYKRRRTEGAERRERQ